MARAYIVLARGDIDDNGLQIMDLWPNSSLRVPAYEPAGQTGYLAWTAQHDTLVAYTVNVTSRMTGTKYGLAAYMADNVEDNDNGNVIMTFARCNTIATNILARVRQGQALELANINAIIQAATGGGASGLTTAHSTGTVEEVLRILGGEVYKVADGAVLSAAAAGFVNPHVRVGGFVVPVLVNNILTYPTDWRNVRTFVQTGALALSCTYGNLGVLGATTYDWENPAKTYGASGTALWCDGTNMTTTVGRAVVVYDNSGALFV